MQAYKLKGTIDESGHLIITEPIDLSPSEVEVIVLQPSSVADDPATSGQSPTETVWVQVPIAP